MRRLLLFAKRPRPGRVKTRLIPPLDERGAVALHRAFIGDQLEFLTAHAEGAEVELWLDGPWSAADLEALPLDGVTISRQCDGDLGQRMLDALRRGRGEHADPTLIVGGDCPTLPARRLAAAFAALEGGADTVVDPATDGGYVLIGMRHPRPELFVDVPWGGPTVLATTRARAAEAGLHLVELDGWYDVDVADDLERLRRDLTDPGVRRRAPRTARLLSSPRSD